MIPDCFTVGDMLHHSAKRHPDKVAVKVRNRQITYKELYSTALKMKALLLELGVQRGDRVGIYLDQSIEQVVAMFGVSLAGGVFVFANPVLKREQVAHILGDCAVSCLISDATLLTRNGVEPPPLMIDMGAVSKAQGEKWLGRISDLPVDETPLVQCAEDVACLIYTSGSTGMPKGVVVPHRTVIDGAKIVSGYLEMKETERVLSVLPINFDYGLNQLTSVILHGATLVLHRFVMPGDLLSLLRVEKITGFPGMPPIWAKLFDDRIKLSGDLNFPDLRYLTNTGGKVPRFMVDKIRELFPGAKLYLMYGLTEAFRSTYLPPDEIDRRPDSMGRAIPNVEIMVVNSQGEECQPGEEGELVHRGALVTRGYWNDQEKTRRIFRNNPRFKDQPHLNELVVYSGDFVRKDEDGFLYFVSRRDDMIKSSGFRVSPTEIEDALAAIDGVANIVVFGRELASGDQSIVAVVETKLDKPVLVKECRARLPNHMVPQEFHFVEEFAKTANGKLDRSGVKKSILDQPVENT